MTLDKQTLQAEIRAKVCELVANIGGDASDIGNDDILPATGLMDSAAILELVVWYEQQYDMPLEQSEINIDNLGSIDAMVNFVFVKKGV